MGICADQNAHGNASRQRRLQRTWTLCRWCFVSIQCPMKTQCLPASFCRAHKEPEIPKQEMHGMAPCPLLVSLISLTLAVVGMVRSVSSTLMTPSAQSTPRPAVGTSLSIQVAAHQRPVT